MLIDRHKPSNAVVQVELDRVRHTDGTESYGVYLRRNHGLAEYVIDITPISKARSEAARHARLNGGVVVLDTTNTKLVRTPGE